MTEPVVFLTRFRGPVLERLVVIEEAVTAWAAGGLTPEARDCAATEAHRLAGSLGMFGEGTGADLAHQLELLLRPADGTPADDAFAHGCLPLARALRGRIEAALGNEDTSAPLADGRTALGDPAAKVGRARTAPTILVADDDDVVAHLLTITLSRQGYTMVRAHDGVEAVELASAQPIDLIFMDVQMPRMDGLEACRVLRADARHADVPILIMTAQGSPDDGPTALAAGATMCLAKPFSVSQVRELARTWLVPPVTT